MGSKQKPMIFVYLSVGILTLAALIFAATIYVKMSECPHLTGEIEEMTDKACAVRCLKCGEIITYIRKV